MDLETFLHHLHFDTDKASPPGWEVDWEDAPLPYKLYRGLPAFSLCHDAPLAFEKKDLPAEPTLRKISHFLWLVYGLSEISQSEFPTEEGLELQQNFRRFVPSGGALYPSELYVYLKMDGLPAGVYHYDAARHCLVLLREGHYDSYIARALGERCDLSSCFGTVFVSAMFWKNFYKYNNFSYRLQGLDAGVLIGQLLEVSKVFGFSSGVYFQYLDRAVNHLLGLDEKEESVYAVIPLSVEPTSWSCAGKADLTAADLCRELPEIQTSHFTKSRRIKPYPMLTQMNGASMWESSKYFRRMKASEIKSAGSQSVALPRINQRSYDLVSLCQKRFSPDKDFVLGKMTLAELAELLQHATVMYQYRNDLDDLYGNGGTRLTIFGCFVNVEGLQDGTYAYNGTEHSLEKINLGDCRLLLQSGLRAGNVNMFQVPLCFHIAGNRDHLIQELGYRGYRIQQMEAGMLTQRLLMAASALELGGHPLLGFDVNIADRLNELHVQNKTSLIQIPVGHYRSRAWLRGRIQS
jgi:SagB-type dehydrogenase family enzyme